MCVQCNLHGAWWIYLLGQVIGALLASLVSTYNYPSFTVLFWT